VSKIAVVESAGTVIVSELELAATEPCFKAFCDSDIKVSFAGNEESCNV
jgi:hypothetical protein